MLEKLLGSDQVVNVIKKRTLIKASDTLHQKSKKLMVLKIWYGIKKRTSVEYVIALP